MKSADPETDELLRRVRQQLILAQVRIMELEDARDDLAAKVAELQVLLGAAQSTADQKIDEAGHLTRVHAELAAQHEQLRRMQDETEEALNRTRANLDATTHALGAERATTANLTARLDAAAANIAAMKSSRSWRWTAWLRSIERTFGTKER